MILSAHISAFLHLCAALWPSWDGIAPSAVKWELLRRLGLWCGCGAGVVLIAAGVYFEMVWEVHGE